MYTEDDIYAILLGNLESEEPEEILSVFKKENGKKLTKHFLAKLPGGQERWRVTHLAHMTHLETWDYTRSQGNKGFSFLVSHSDKSVTIDAVYVETHNPAYFSGRRNRNLQRKAMMGNPGAREALAKAMNLYRVAKEELDKAKARLDEVLADEAALFSADSYDWERMCGAREPRK